MIPPILHGLQVGAIGDIPDSQLTVEVELLGQAVRRNEQDVHGYDIAGDADGEVPEPPNRHHMGRREHQGPAISGADELVVVLVNNDDPAGSTLLPPGIFELTPNCGGSESNLEAGLRGQAS